jgi:hypothetical protein
VSFIETFFIRYRGGIHMQKVGSKRNFGWGKQLAFAGRQALLDKYGAGKYGTKAAHNERFGEFIKYVQSEHEIKDAGLITSSTINAYAEHLADQVREGNLKISYAQNLLSSVNVCMSAIRGDQNLRISPADHLGHRTFVRHTAPLSLNKERLSNAIAQIRDYGHDRAASAIDLTEALGLRVKEASLLDCREALQQARATGMANITAGTKGGRGNHVDRWVPITPRAMSALEKAAEVQGNCRNLITSDKSWAQFNNHVHYVWGITRDSHNLGTIHDNRSAYACHRYEQITGHPAPVVAGHRAAERAIDTVAREIIAHELGHNRIDVVAAYIGSSK